MDTLVYEMKNTERTLNDVTKRIENYVGKDVEYLRHMYDQKARLEMKVGLLAQSIILFEEALKIN